MTLTLLIILVAAIAVIGFLAIRGSSENNFKGFSNTSISKIKAGLISDKDVSEMRAAIEQDYKAKTQK